MLTDASLFTVQATQTFGACFLMATHPVHGQFSAFPGDWRRLWKTVHQFFRILFPENLIEMLADGSRYASIHKKRAPFGALFYGATNQKRVSRPKRTLRGFCHTLVRPHIWFGLPTEDSARSSTCSVCCVFRMLKMSSEAVTSRPPMLNE